MVVGVPFLSEGPTYSFNEPNRNTMKPCAHHMSRRAIGEGLGQGQVRVTDFILCARLGASGEDTLCRHSNVHTNAQISVTYITWKGCGLFTPLSNIRPIAAPTGRGSLLQANEGCGKRCGPRDVLAALPAAPIGLERRTAASGSCDPVGCERRTAASGSCDRLNLWTRQGGAVQWPESVVQALFTGQCDLAARVKITALAVRVVRPNGQSHCNWSIADICTHLSYSVKAFGQGHRTAMISVQIKTRSSNLIELQLSHAEEIGTASQVSRISVVLVVTDRQCSREETNG
ncbi:hypothetical protein UY3_12962 [Chelonia mydas]|uniref:Uncharacterized protein n=1 Tax=Chelonia mydas TaxID=8469 RepID=M7BP10_CHEMY|nr:hypothetical protein UY3_12962 [Chelonia mydas]